MTDQRLPDFEGHHVETQRLKLSGAVDKDQYIADHNEGDDIVFVVIKARVDNVGHKFIDDGVIRVEAIKVLDAQPGNDNRAERLYKELAAEEIDRRRERSGQPSLDDAADEQAAADAAANALAKDDESGDDEVASMRTKTGAKVPFKRVAKKAPAKKSTRKAAGADKRRARKPPTK